MEYLDIDKFEVKSKMLDWQKRGLQQTSSGYGSKLVTFRMLKYNNIWHRIYAMCYSNNGTLYILVKGKMVIVS
jgi:hypothetical protein